MILDEWQRWQEGGCLNYTVALLRLRPNLEFGTLYDGNTEAHHFAYDERFAYDSAGRHALPYHGITGDLKPVLNESPDWYEEPDELEVLAAITHIRRHKILRTEELPE